MRPLLLPKGIVIAVVLLVAVSIGIGYEVVIRLPVKQVITLPESKLASAIAATPYPSPTPTPTPKPLTFAEMNTRYGPCVSLPVLMYHHIQSADQAKERKQTGLTVTTDVFREQMQYLKDKGYTTIKPGQLNAFFESGTSLPDKPVLLTFDDGYDDNFTDMFPVLREMGFSGTVFLATGLAENPGYLTWGQIGEMANAGIYFGNHTWSHKNMKAQMDTIAYELGTAQTQLTDHGLNSDKIFAFPYGLMSGQADTYLQKEGYSLAFDTLPGRIQCKQKKFALTRTRVGNTNLSSYGL